MSYKGKRESSRRKDTRRKRRSDEQVFEETAAFLSWRFLPLPLESTSPFLPQTPSEMSPERRYSPPLDGNSFSLLVPDSQKVFLSQKEFYDYGDGVFRQRSWKFSDLSMKEISWSAQEGTFIKRERQYYEMHRQEIKKTTTRAILKDLGDGLSEKEIRNYLSRAPLSYHHRIPFFCRGGAKDGCLLPNELHNLIHKDFDLRRQDVSSCISQYRNQDFLRNPYLLEALAKIDGVFVHGEQIWVAIIDPGEIYCLPKLHKMKKPKSDFFVPESALLQKIQKRFTQPVLRTA